MNALLCARFARAQRRAIRAGTLLSLAESKPQSQRVRTMRSALGNPPLPTRAWALRSYDRPLPSLARAALNRVIAILKWGGPLRSCVHPPKSCGIAARNRVAAPQSRAAAVGKWEGGLRKWVPPPREWVPPLHKWGGAGRPSMGFSEKTSCHPHFTGGSFWETDTWQGFLYAGTGVGASGASEVCSKRSASSAASALAPGMLIFAAALSEL